MVTPEMILSGLVGGFLNGGMYAVVAIGFILIYKSSGVLNFAQGEMVMVGSYFIFLVISQLHFPIWAGLLLGVVLAGLFGWILHETTLRPLIGQPLFSMMMMTVAYALFFRGIVPVIWGPSSLPAPQIIPVQTISIGIVKFSLVSLIGFIVACLLTVGFVIYFKYTKQGLLLRSVCEDHQLAEATGINVRSVLDQVWIVSSMVALIAGILISQTTSVGDVVAEVAMKGLPVALLVGLESISGALLGGVIIGVCEMLAALYLDPITKGGMMDTFPFIVMLIVILIRPYGLFGLKRIERV